MPPARGVKVGSLRFALMLISAAIRASSDAVWEEECASLPELESSPPEARSPEVVARDAKPGIVAAVSAPAVRGTGWEIVWLFTAFVRENSGKPPFFFPLVFILSSSFWWDGGGVKGVRDRMRVR